MDKTISAAEANRQFSRVLREVRERGTTYVVTSHGEPVARITPPAQPNVDEKEQAKQRLLERLRSQPAMNSGPWSRDEAYDDDL
jgi:prevent-host-death family protein